MRPLIVYTGLFAEPENNAAGKRVYGNSLILESLGYDVLMLGKTLDPCYSGEKKYSDHIFFVSYPEYGRIKYKEYVAYLKKCILEKSEKPVCIIRYGAPGLCFFDNAVFKFAHRHDINVIADVVDWLSADGKGSLFNLVKTFDTYMEKAYFNKKSDGIIAISSFLGDYYKKFVKNVVVIPPIVSEYRKNNALNTNIKIMYAGLPFRMGLKVKNVHKIKDRLDLALESLAEVYRRGVTNFRFAIYGITKEQYLTAFPEHKEIIDATENVITFYGRKTMCEIRAELAKSDFSILLREKTRGTMAGFPTKVVESMSCGTPMITTRTSNLEDYIENKKNGFFVDIGNKEKLISQLIDILNIEPDMMQSMKDNCFMKKCFLPEVFKEKMKYFINKILE